MIEPAIKYEGRRSLASVDRQPDRDPEEQQIHDRVGHRRQLLEERERLVVRVRCQQEDPGERPDADRDDERVDKACAVASRAALANKQEDAGDQERVHAQVQQVPDRRERRRRSEEPVVVVRDDVAGDEERLADRHEVPGETLTRIVHPGADHDRDGRRQADHVEQRPHADGVDEDEGREDGAANRQVEGPGSRFHRFLGIGLMGDRP